MQSFTEMFPHSESGRQCQWVVRDRGKLGFCIVVGLQRGDT